MKRKILLILLCLFFLGMAAFFGLRTYREWNEYRVGEKSYRELAGYVQMETAPPAEQQLPEQESAPATAPDTAPGETEPEEINWPTVDFEGLQAVNPDVVAWIYIEGTNINYPVVRGEDNSVYLDRLVDGTRNGAGSIFMDYRNEKDLSDRNTVLYGHHMQNGTMFAQITGYKDQAFYDAHPYGLLMTPEGNYKVEFFAGYISDMNGQAWKMQFGSEEEYARWLEEAVAKSTFLGSVEPTALDRVVTLSTCTYEYNDARYVLVGVLRQETTQQKGGTHT